MFAEELPSEADIVIIGCGVIGCAIARELSRYKLNVVAIDKEPDVGWGVTKGSMGWIHPFVPQFKGIKSKLVLEGNERYDKLSDELDVPFRRYGLLIVALSFIQFLALIIAYLYLKFRKIKIRWIGKKRLREIEPFISSKAKAAIFVPSAGVTDPVKLAIAYAENAVENGVKIVLNTKVTGLRIENNEIRGVITNKGEIKTRWVINSAGVFSDEIEKIAGITKRKMWHGKGVMVIFDPVLGDMYHHLIAPMPIRLDPRTKGGAIGLTVDGLPIWGPNLVEADGKSDVSVSKDDIDMIIDKFKPLLRFFPKNLILKYYAGVRPVDETSWDFVLGPTEIKGFINASYILSPGLTAAPVIAERIIEILQSEGLKLELKKRYSPFRRDIKSIRDMNIEEIDKLIQQNNDYGEIICLCNNVTKAEIIEAIRRGARTIDSIKFRTGACMGRCQGSRCLPKIIDILVKETGMNLNEITLKGAGSEIFLGD